jgi:diguanylate cyclase (GGDEF)-like protein
MRRWELTVVGSDGSGSDEETQILRTRPPSEAPVTVVRAAFGSGPMSLWVATPGETGTVGRSPDADLYLADPSVSRYHARFETDANGRLALVDLDSTNGTFVNQAQLRGRRLVDVGDRIQIGGVAISIDRMSPAELAALRTAASRLDQVGKDALTGLVTRGWVDEGLLGWLERHRQRSETVCCLFLDIDEFKDVNDSAGHAAGDLVLKTVAQLIRGAIRDGDVPVRFGGDEMLVFLGKCRIAEAVRVAERIRRTVADNDFGGAVRGGVTVSIGAAEHHGETGEQWIARADAALYRAKASRNKVVAAD